MRTTMYVVPHTHWDREWYEPFQTFRLRLLDLVDDVLDLLDSYPQFAFTLDGQLATVDDYLQVRPEAEKRIRTHVATGRLAIGPWQILLDEFLVSGETIVRNLRTGWRRGTELGAPMPVGYLPDMFGHVAQMPQILARAGIGHAVVWRGVPTRIDRHRFDWVAPDGSRVLTEYLYGGYGNAASLLALPDGVEAKVARLVDRMRPWFGDDPPLAMLGTDHQPPATDLVALVEGANRTGGHQMRLATLASYVLDDAGNSAHAGRWDGELRSGGRANLLMGVTSLRMPIRAAAARAERQLERYAEPLTALHGGEWPARLLDLAWRRVIDNSAHDSVCGCSHDEVADQVLVRYAEARRIAAGLAQRAVAEAASRVPSGAFAVVNPSPNGRADLVELDVTGGLADGPVALRTANGQLVATQTCTSAAGVLLDAELPAAQAVAVFDRMHGRELFGRKLNGVHLQERALTFDVDVHADPPSLDVDDLRTQVETAAAAEPDTIWRVRIVGRARRTLLAVVPAPALGVAGVRAVTARVAPADPVRVTGRTMATAQVSVAVEPAGTLRLQANDVVLRSVGRLVDGGDAGDSYNYAPPFADQLVDQPTQVRVDTVEHGPLRGVLRVRRRYRWPAGLDGDGRCAEGRQVDVTMRVTLHAGEPFVRLALNFDNACDDHRLRLHVPLPAPVAGSAAEGQFAVVARGLVAEGGHGEHPLPTFPAHGFVAADGLAVLLEHVTEYELVDDGTELALTVLRSIGLISRNAHRWRTEPAGPQVPIPGAQCRGRMRFRCALMPLAGPWERVGVTAAAEAYRHPFVTASGRGGAQESLRDLAGLCVDGDNVVMTALRREGDWLELRLVNCQHTSATAVVGDGLTAARRADLLGTPGEQLHVTAGRLHLQLGAWEIATVHLRRQAVASPAG